MPWTRSVSEFTINQATTGSQGAGQVTALADGGFVVVWSSPHGGGQDIYARVFGADGLPAGDEFMVNAAFAGADIRPEVVAFDGGYTVVWQRTESGDLNLYGRTFHDGGAVSDEFLLHDTTTGFQANPALDGTTPGIAAFAAGTSVYLTTLLPGGAGADVLVSDSAQSNTVTYVQALKAAGTWLISYQGGDGQAKARIYDETGGTFSAEITLSTTAYHPRIHALNSGGFVTTTGFPDVHAQIFNANGVAIGAPIAVATDPAAAETQGDALALSSGGFVVFWTVFSSPTEVYAQRYTDMGLAFGEELKLTLNTTDGAMMPQVAEMTDGRLIVTYQSTRGGVDDVFAQILELPQNTVFGTAADEAIFLGARNDTLFGQDGNDLLEGMDGHDWVEGQRGDDTVFGGVGHDTLSGGSNRDRLYGGRGHDEIEGGRARDWVDGGRGDDTIWGGSTKDVLYGNFGDDLIFGGEGNDRLVGNEDNDTLTGDDGADLFVFKTGDGADVITDFEDGIDRIRVVTGAANFGDVTVTDMGADVLIAFSDVTVLLLGVDHTLISGADFSF